MTQLSALCGPVCQFKTQLNWQELEQEDTWGQADEGPGSKNFTHNIK